MRWEKIKVDCMEKVKGMGVGMMENLFDGFEGFGKVWLVLSWWWLFVFGVWRKRLLW